MKRFQEQLQSKAKTVHLTAAERRDVKERLQAYMEYHPLPATRKTSKTKPTAGQTLMSEPFAVVQFPFGMLFKAAGAAFALVLLVVPFAAERAVPGDTLYAVKVEFNEELRGTLLFNSTAKVEWETERLNRRIAEARLLASEGRLTEAAEAEVAAAVREHAATAQRQIDALRTVDADSAAIAAIALDTTLEVQMSSLETDENAVQLDNTSTARIASVISASRSNQADSASSTTPSFEKLMARLEQNTTRIYELRESLLTMIPEERLVEVDRRIADINRSIEEAIVAVETDESAARQGLVGALQRSQKIILFMTEVEMIATVDIEELVPMVLTTDEKASKQRALLAELTTKRAEIVNLIAVEEDAGVVEKAELAVLEIDAALQELASTTAFLVFEERALDAVVLANDTIASFASEAREVDGEEGVEEGEERASSTESGVPPVSTTTPATASSTTPDETAESVPTTSVDTES